MRSRDGLRSVDPRVGIAQIVCQDQDHIRRSVLGVRHLLDGLQPTSSFLLGLGIRRKYRFQRNRIGRCRTTHPGFCSPSLRLLLRVEHAVPVRVETLKDRCGRFLGRDILRLAAPVLDRNRTDQGTPDA